MERAVHLVQGLERGRLLPQDVPPEPPGRGLSGLVGHELAAGDGEDVVEFFEGALFGLRDEEEDHDKLCDDRLAHFGVDVVGVDGGGISTHSSDVEAGVEAEGADIAHDGEDGGEGDGEDGGPEEASGDGPAHADFAVAEGENLGAVGERDGTFAGRVEAGEDVDEQGDAADVRGVAFGDEEAEAGDEQGPGHVGEGEEEEGAAAVGVDGPDGGPGEDEVDEACEERGPVSTEVVGSTGDGCPTYRSRAKR